MRDRFSIGVAAILALGTNGCAGSSSSSAHNSKHTNSATTHQIGDTDDKMNAEIVSERAKLSPEDRALVEAQEWCVVSTDERLGSMGPPIKLEVGGQSVFVCCKGCQRKAKADPAKTLATLEELKSKKKQQSGQR